MYCLVDSSGARPYSITDLRRDHPHVSFPTQPSDADLAAWGVYPCDLDPRPAVAYDQNVEPGPVVQRDGRWVLTWTVVTVSAEDAAQRLAERWTSVRSDRNERLSACDWTQLPDSPLSNEQRIDWQVYRQALRDITTQESPFAIVWPEVPA